MVTSVPKTLHWLLDGAVQDTVEGTGTTRTFTWPLGVPGEPGSVSDGVYLVGSEAFNQYGVAGPSRSVTVTINRSQAAAPTDLAGGRGPPPDDASRDVVNLEWLPNPEGDLRGYRVFRLDPGGRTLVCDFPPRTECRDDAPPARADLEYVVVAYDTHPDTGAERASADSAVLHVASG